LRETNQVNLNVLCVTILVAFDKYTQLNTGDHLIEDCVLYTFDLKIDLLGETCQFSALSLSLKMTMTGRNIYSWVLHIHNQWNYSDKINKLSNSLFSCTTLFSNQFDSSAVPQCSIPLLSSTFSLVAGEFSRKWQLQGLL
ncbi:hypothetical protein Leryth_015815, partial [Lithospermum erythrorhizon]